MAIAYVSIGALDVEASLPFFDATFGAAGLERSFHDGGWAGYGEKGKDADLYICTPFDGQPATAGNGAMAVVMKVPRGFGLRMVPASMVPISAIRRATSSASLPAPDRA